MMDDAVRTYPLALEETENGITVSVPWAQRQANGAVIVRIHLVSPRHAAGELLLNEGDVTALDGDERPLRTQVRRFWGYSTLADVTPAHLQTARFDVGFRVDLASTQGECGLVIAIIRTFRPNEGPRAVGGPWVFRLRVADERDVGEAVQAEAARQEAARSEAAQRAAERAERLPSARGERGEDSAAGPAERMAGNGRATHPGLPARQSRFARPVRPLRGERRDRGERGGSLEEESNDVGDVLVPSEAPPAPDMNRGPVSLDATEGNAIQPGRRGHVDRPPALADESPPASPAGDEIASTEDHTFAAEPAKRAPRPRGVRAAQRRSPRPTDAAASGEPSMPEAQELHPPETEE